MSIEKQISIDSEFQGLIPPLKPDEYQGLKESIEQEGCRDALVVWNSLILDGHNRYKICKELNIDYIITEIDLPDREAAKAWIERNQLNRRNLTIDQIRLIRGRLYNRMKTVGHGAKTGYQNDTQKLQTSEKLAGLFGQPIQNGRDKRDKARTQSLRRSNDN